MIDVTYSFTDNWEKMQGFRGNIKNRYLKLPHFLCESHVQLSGIHLFG